MSTVAWAAFFAAAAFGAVSRYLLDGVVQSRTKDAFPWGTFFVNVSGCFFLGIVTGSGIYRDLDRTVITVIGTGALGAYTTFSTVMFDTVRLVEQGAIDAALGNALGNVLTGLVAAGAGLAIVALISL